MDNFFLNDIVAEIAPVLTDRSVSRIGGSGSLISIDMGLSSGQALVVRLDQSNSGMYLARETTSRGRRQPDRPNKRAEPPFTLFLKSRLADGRLTEILKPVDDRIVNLIFDAAAPGCGSVRYTLLLALTGRSTNAFLLGANGFPEAAFREVGAKPPAPDSGTDQSAQNQPPMDFISTAKAELSRADLSKEELADHYLLISSRLGPVLKREFEYRSTRDTPANALESILKDLSDKPHVPLVYSSFPLEQAGTHPANAARDVLLSCVRLSSTAKMIEREFRSFSEAAQAGYAAIESIERFNSRCVETKKALATLLKKDEELLRSISADMSRFKDPGKFKRYGDLLLASLATATRTPTAAIVKDLYDDAQPDVEIKLEEGESLQQAAARYYTFYQKARRALKALEPRAVAVAAKVAKLRALAQSLQSEPTVTNLARIEEQIGTGHPASRGRKLEKSSKKESTRTRVVGRRFVSSEGYEIVVGKTDRENDTITFRVAGSLDVWLHAADYPGSHVVVRNPTRQPVPYNTVIEAASVAAYYSQAKKEKKAAVHYTQKKFVTKPPKAKPGLVRLSSFKTVMVEPGIKVKKLEG
jgi:predicted ribosome quality control (RQC) complex YloA/Tae2 family protein